MPETVCSGRCEAPLTGGHRLRRRIALIAAITPVLIVTLLPGGIGIQEEISIWCVVCGWRGASDAILNAALFVPFGLALGAAGRKGLGALAIAAAVSLGLEIAQVYVPGRYPGLGDVLYNALGAGFGAAAFRRRGSLLPRRGSEAARRLTWWWAALGLVALSVQIWLTGPAIPAREHTLAWTPDTPELNRYEGEVLSVSIGGRRLVPGPVGPDDPLLIGLREGTELSVRLVAGPLPDAIVPLVLLSYGGGNGSETLFLGVDGQDLIVRYRTRGMTIRLDRPFDRWRRGASWTEGDTVTILLHAVGGGIEVALSGATPPVRPARLAVPSARGWGFLMYNKRLARAPGGRFDFVWVLVFALPLGFWGPLRHALLAAGVWGVALMGAPAVAPLIAASPQGVAGALAGVLLGALARFVGGNPEPFKWWKPLPPLDEPRTRPGPDGPQE